MSSMELSTFKKLSVLDLSAFLGENGVSSEAIQSLRTNQVSGHALLLVNEDELKEMLTTIGDRAVVRDVLRKVKETPSDCEMSSASRNDIESDNDSSQSSPSANSFENSLDLPLNEDEDMDVELASSREAIRPNEVSKNMNAEATVIEVDKAKPVFTSKRQQEPPLPRPFELPQNFPTIVAAGLKDMKLVGLARAKFITVIAQSVYRFKDLPTEDEYFHIAQELVKKWPFLNNKKGNRHLVLALRMRMAYLRKPTTKKRGDPSKRKSSERATSLKLVKPSIPYVPLIPEGEDEASLERHLKKLKEEMKRHPPSKNIVRELMRRTFPLCRRIIMEVFSSILQTYPALKFPDELLREFDRVMERNCEVEFTSTWKSIFPKILDLAKVESVPKLQQFIDVYLHDDVSDDYQSILALGCLVYLVPDVRTKVDHTRVITLLEDAVDVNYEATLVPINQPCLVVRISNEDVQDCFLVIEKKVMFKVNTKHAVVVFFASFYVFNLHYVSGCTNFYLLFECLFLNKKIPGRKPSSTSRTYYF